MMEEARLAITQGEGPTEHTDETDTMAYDTGMMEDVLAGRVEMEISHAGGEYGEIMEALRDKLQQKRCVYSVLPSILFP